MDVNWFEKSGFFQVPYEVLNKKFRTAQKIIDREVSHVLTANSDLSNIVEKQSVKVSDVTGILDGVIDKLQVLKRKVFLTCYSTINHLRVVKNIFFHQNNSWKF